MRIEAREHNRVYFYKLMQGDVFLWANQYHMVTNLSEDKEDVCINAVELDTGILRSFPGDTVVEILPDAKLVV